MSRKREALVALGKTILDYRKPNKEKKYCFWEHCHLCLLCTDCDSCPMYYGCCTFYSYKKVNVAYFRKRKTKFTKNVREEFKRRARVLTEVARVVNSWPSYDAAFLEMCKRPLHEKFGPLVTWDGTGPAPDISHLRLENVYSETRLDIIKWLNDLLRIEEHFFQANDIWYFLPLCKLADPMKWDCNICPFGPEKMGCRNRKEIAAFEYGPAGFESRHKNERKFDETLTALLKFFKITILLVETIDNHGDIQKLLNRSKIINRRQ